MRTNSPVEAAAEYICVELYPKELQSTYVQHMRVLYSAEPIIYVLQELASGITTVFFGLIANYLYDKTQANKYDIEQKVQLESRIAEQEREIKRLEEMLVAPH